MRKPKPTRERAARALCELANIPPGIKMDGSPMWVSYLPELDAVLQAALSSEEWDRLMAAESLGLQARNTALGCPIQKNELLQLEVSRVEC